jgi:hypothetical protein
MKIIFIRNLFFYDSFNCFNLQIIFEIYIANNMKKNILTQLIIFFLYFY